MVVSCHVDTVVLMSRCNGIVWKSALLLLFSAVWQRKSFKYFNRGNVESYVENHLIFPISPISGSFGEIVPLTGFSLPLPSTLGVFPALCLMWVNSLSADFFNAFRSGSAVLWALQSSAARLFAPFMLQHALRPFIRLPIIVNTLLSILPSLAWWTTPGCLKCSPFVRQCGIIDIYQIEK